MNFLEKLLQRVLHKNLLLYNFVVTISTLLIFFGIFYLSIILIQALVNYGVFNNSISFNSVLLTIIIPIIIGILDFAFCLFILIVNLKFKSIEVKN